MPLSGVGCLLPLKSIKSSVLFFSDFRLSESSLGHLYICEYNHWDREIGQGGAPRDLQGNGKILFLKWTAGLNHIIVILQTAHTCLCNYGIVHKLRKSISILFTTKVAHHCTNINFSFLKHFFFKYSFIWLHQVLVAACGIHFPDQGLNLGPLH